MGLATSLAFLVEWTPLSSGVACIAVVYLDLAVDTFAWAHQNNQAHSYRQA
jgi:hypothetical protein